MTRDHGNAEVESPFLQVRKHLAADPQRNESGEKDQQVGGCALRKYRASNYGKDQQHAQVHVKRIGNGIDQKAQADGDQNCVDPAICLLVVWRGDDDPIEDRQIQDADDPEPDQQKGLWVSGGPEHAAIEHGNDQYHNARDRRREGGNAVLQRRKTELRVSSCHAQVIEEQSQPGRPRPVACSSRGRSDDDRFDPRLSIAQRSSFSYQIHVANTN